MSSLKNRERDEIKKKGERKRKGEVEEWDKEPQVLCNHGTPAKKLKFKQSKLGGYYHYTENTK